MKQFLSVILVFLIAASSGYAQDAFYYYDEQKIPLNESSKWTVVQVPETARSALAQRIDRRSDIQIRRVLDEERGFYWLEGRGEQDLGPEVIDQLSQEVTIRRTIPTYYRAREDSSHFVIIDEFQVQFESTMTRTDIDELNAKYGVEVTPFESEIDERQAREYNEYVLRVTEESEYDALEAANQYHEDPRTKWASPQFLLDIRPESVRSEVQTDGSRRSAKSASDPLYSKQYYLHNTSSNLGSADVDIDAPEAGTTRRAALALLWPLLTGGSVGTKTSTAVNL